MGMKRSAATAAFAAAVCALGLAAAAAQEPPAAAPATAPPAAAAPVPTTPDYVTREEYERLRAELDSVRRQVDEKRPPGQSRGGAGSLFDNDRFLVTGYATAGFSDEHAGNSTFSAGINPIFLWRINDRIFVEAEVELGLNNESGSGETEVNLEYADINFILNDYATLRVGKFLTPFGQFPERLHPAWINKLPDFPLVYTEDGGLVPFASLGAEVRGAVPLRSGGDSKLVYAAYVANGPSLITDDADAAGTITDTNFDDVNSNKAVGGRVGYLPVPELEVGASVLYGDVADGTNALIWGVDASYSRDIAAIRGTLDARTEWVW